MKKFIAILFLVVECLVNNVQCNEFDLQKNYSQLSPQEPFALFDLCLSQDEIDILQSISADESINNETTVLNVFGTLNQFEYKVIEFLKSLGNSDEDSQISAKIIDKIVKNCLNTLGFESAWITIRFFKKNSSYDIPRWHIDSESLYKPKKGYLCKIACALKGPSTIFSYVPDAVRKALFNVQSNMRSKAYASKVGTREQRERAIRSDLDDALQSYEMLSAQPGQGAVFIMGNENTGAVHSEPAMPEDRIFMSIVPGSHEQIQELYKNWHIIIENRFKSKK